MATTFTGTLKIGMMDDERVRAVQKTLNARIKSGLDPDADFGALTYDAVREYQRGAGLPITGIVDLATWNNLMGPVTMSPVNAATMMTAQPETPMWVWGLIIVGAILIAKNYGDGK